jgi:hypothetical protein
MNTSTVDERVSNVQLAPPGAGLPPVELWIGRGLFKLWCWGGDVAKFTQKLESERRKIRQLYSSCDDATGARRILIPRLRGMEDSSRHWSVWMTLDHVRIVNNAMASTIRTLSAGEIPQRVASTAAVKPDISATGEVRSAYEASCDEVLAAAAASPNLRTAVRFAHPWFGPLDAFSWYALAGRHMDIHRKQLEQILAGLKQNGRRE